MMMLLRPLALAPLPGRSPALLVGARPWAARRKPPLPPPAAARRNDTTKGPRHDTRPSAANARSRSRRRKGEGADAKPGGSDPLVPEELLREASGTEAYRYARALSAAVAARKRPLALRTALAMAVARPGRLLAPAAPARGVGGGGVRPAALAARLVQLSETLGISVADAAELLAGAAEGGEEDDHGDDEQQQQQQQRQQRQRGRRRAGDSPARPLAPPPPAAALEDVMPLRLLRAAEALVAALELDLDEEEEGEEEDADADGAVAWLPLPPPPPSSSAPPKPYTLPAEPPYDDPRVVSLRLAVRALARRPALLDASPLDVRRRALAAAAALGLPPRLAARRLIAREPALLDVEPQALSKRLDSLSRGLEQGEGALALALVLREPRLLLPPSRALAANLAALPGVFRKCKGAANTIPMLLLHAPALALVPAAELARRLEALLRLLPAPATTEPTPEEKARPAPWPLLRTPCGLEFDPCLLLLPPARLAERARHLQRLERLAAAGAGLSGSGGGSNNASPDPWRLRQRRAQLLAMSSAALDGWCADQLHLPPPPSGGEETALAAAARQLLSGGGEPA